MNNYRVINSVDDIQQRMKGGISAAMGIFELMNTGACSPESYMSGLYATLDYLEGLNRELGREMRDAFADLKKEAQG